MNKNPFEMIHEDYHEDYYDFFEKLLEKETKTSFDYLANYRGIGYTWYRVYAVSVPDDSGEIYRVVGQVVDIQGEKGELEIFRHHTEKDQMTGVYNRQEAKRLIRTYLENREKSSEDALIIMDLDDFSKVNDSYGHIIGILL
jgi:GGDEF domain-containing protein